MRRYRDKTNPPHETLYKYLGVKRGASLTTCKNAAKETLKKIHTDKHPHLPSEMLENLTKLTCIINETRNILCCKQRRFCYNILLRHGVLPPHGGESTDFRLLNDAIDALTEEIFGVETF